MDNIQEVLDNKTTEETLFNYCMQYSIDDFAYRGIQYNVIDMITEQDIWLDMVGSIVQVCTTDHVGREITTPTFFINGSFIRGLN